VGKSPAELGEIRDKLVRGARRKGELIRWLLERQSWDFFIAVFGETHRGGHILWPEAPGTGSVPAAALLDVYRAVDEALGEVLSAPALAGAAVMVFALHGMQANPSQEHFLPALMDRVNARFVGDGVPDGTPVPTGRRGIVRRLRESVPPAIQNRIAQAVPVTVRDAVVNRSIVAGHDWRRTPGFDLLTDLNGYLRLNVRGREREGAYERDGEVLARYVSWIRECFGSLRVAGSEEPVVAEVRRTAEAFPGGRVDHLPDLVVRWSGHPPVTRVTSPVIGDVTAELATGRSGNHHREGFCVASRTGAPLPPIANGRELASFVVRSFA
jgi:predicted AlkP superfamily phosphohydrolase/phosphomutase